MSLANEVAQRKALTCRDKLHWQMVEWDLPQRQCRECGDWVWQGQLGWGLIRRRRRADSWAAKLLSCADLHRLGRLVKGLDGPAAYDLSGGLALTLERGTSSWLLYHRTVLRAGLGERSCAVVQVGEAIARAAADLWPLLPSRPLVEGSGGPTCAVDLVPGRP